MDLILNIGTVHVHLDGGSSNGAAPVLPEAKVAPVGEQLADYSTAARTRQTLRRWMARHHLDTATAAEEIGCHPSSLSSWLKDTNPSAKYLDKLRQVIGA